MKLPTDGSFVHFTARTKPWLKAQTTASTGHAAVVWLAEFEALSREARSKLSPALSQEMERTASRTTLAARPPLGFLFSMYVEDKKQEIKQAREGDMQARMQKRNFANKTREWPSKAPSFLAKNTKESARQGASAQRQKTGKQQPAQTRSEELLAKTAAKKAAVEAWLKKRELRKQSAAARLGAAASGQWPAGRPAVARPSAWPANGTSRGCQNSFIDLGANVGDALKSLRRAFSDPPPPKLTTLEVRMTRWGVRPQLICYVGVEGNPRFTSQLRQLEREVREQRPSVLQAATLHTETVVSDKVGEAMLFLDTISAKKNYWGSSLASTHDAVVCGQDAQSIDRRKKYATIHGVEHNTSLSSCDGTQARVRSETVTSLMQKHIGLSMLQGGGSLLYAAPPSPPALVARTPQLA